MASESLIAIMIGSLFVNNYVLARFLGICSFIGVSRKWKPALGMGLAVTFVLATSTLISWFVNNLFLAKYNIEYLQVVVYILIIATFVQFLELFMKKYSESLYKTLGIYLPLITTNCIILGVVLINTQKNYSILASIIHGISAGGGYTLALMLMSSIRERIEGGPVPDAMKGIPIAFITAALLSLSFMAFNGMIR